MIIDIFCLIISQILKYEPNFNLWRLYIYSLLAAEVNVCYINQIIFLIITSKVFKVILTIDILQVPPIQAFDPYCMMGHQMTISSQATGPNSSGIVGSVMSLMRGLSTTK